MVVISWTLFAGLYAVVDAHTVISYPGWRGNNLAVTDAHPYGMQYSFPCGGLAPTSNRTNWPVTGGAIAIQPGWFQGHKTATFYVNLRLGADGVPASNSDFIVSQPFIPSFEIIGPTNSPYPGTFCLPQLPLPSGVSPKVGDLATIQVIELLSHGGALYNCADIEFADVENVPEVNAQNCFNTTSIKFKRPDSESGSGTNSTESSPAPAGTLTNPWPTANPRTSVSCPTLPPAPTCTPTACPACNMGAREQLGISLPVGMLALGFLGL